MFHVKHCSDHPVKRVAFANPPQRGINKRRRLKYYFMRMRKKKHTDERIQACIDYIYHDNMPAYDDKPVYPVCPVYLEIGCGKGDFICAMAQKFPDINFIAVEKISDVAVIAIEKAKNFNLPNVKFMIADAKNLADCFDSGQISRIYLNFSDPWHKRYQHNNRLTAPAFLEIYKKILNPDSKIILKTDNKDFFDYSVKSLSSNGFIIEHKTYDLYSSEFIENNIQTEYERNFVSQGIKICYLEAILL